MTQRPNDNGPRRFILRSFQSPGDVVVLTAAVRDLHAAYPGRFLTDVRTSAAELWDHNPHVTRLSDSEPGVTELDMQYPLIHQSNQRPYHFLHGYAQFLEERLGVRVPLTRFHGDIHLSAAERATPPLGSEVSVPERFWIVVAGGKYDFTAKWWDPACYQAVIDQFRGRITFVQCGEQGHWHPRLSGVVDLIGRTRVRDFVRLMHHADGVLCGVTMAMHLAAAVPTRPGRPPQRACVVVAGGREPPHWEAYPQHQFLSTTGALSCCATGGCWKSRCQLVGDGDEKDRRDVCEQPVQVTPELRIPKCMHLIMPADVIRAIELYYRGGALVYRGEDDPPAQTPDPVAPAPPPIVRPVPHESASPPAVAPEGGPVVRIAEAAVPPRPLVAPVPPQNRGQSPAPPERPVNVFIMFRHGLGDAVKFTAVLAHLRRYHPDWHVEVGALVGKHSAFHGLCHRVLALGREHPNLARYDQVLELAWDECHTCYAEWPSTKVERCLLEVFRLHPVIELCRYTLHPGERARQAARRYLEHICHGRPARADGRFSVGLIHYQGNTSRDRKDIPVEVVRRLCDDIIQAGAVPVILDWDYRSPLPDGQRIHCPNVEAELWGRTGTGDAETLAALVEQSALLVGVDSGPLHVAGATATPAIGIWRGHHPVHFFAPADNVLHLVPEGHTGLLRGDRAAGESFFRRHYRHQTYADLENPLRALVRERLEGDQGGLV